MLINFNSPSNLIATEILAGSHVLLYGTTNNLELDCVTDNTTPLDIQACNFNRWTLDIVRDLSTPGDPLIHRDITGNIATGSRIYIEVSLTNAACYAYMAGNSSVPVVFSLKGYESSEETAPGCVIQLPMAIRTTVNETLPLADDVILSTSDRPVTARAIARALRGRIPRTIIEGLATVAWTGNYYDLLNRPVVDIVNDSVITVNVNGTLVTSFTVNQAFPSTVDIAVPTQLAQLSGDADHRTVTDAQTQDWNSRLSLVIVNGTTSTVAGGTASLEIETGDPDAVVAEESMPEASEENAGKVALYTGTTTDAYMQGHVYECAEQPHTQPTELTIDYAVEGSMPPAGDPRGTYRWDDIDQCFKKDAPISEDATFVVKYNSNGGEQPWDQRWFVCYAMDDGRLLYECWGSKTGGEDGLSGEYDSWSSAWGGDYELSVEITGSQTITEYAWIDKTARDGKLTEIIVNGQTATVAGGTASVTVPAITEMVVNGTTATVSGSTASVTIPTGSEDAVEALDAMPTASEETAGRVVLYSGTATADYATGHQYRCDAETATPTYRVVVNQLAEATWGFNGVYEAADTPDEYVSHTGGAGKDEDVWLRHPDPSDPWGLYDASGNRQYILLDGGPAGTYDSIDPVQPELWGTATVTEETPGGVTYHWTDITPVQDDAVTSVIVNGQTASVQGGTASVDVPVIDTIVANGSTATINGTTATVGVPISGGTITNNSITITDGGTNTTFLGAGTASVAGKAEFGGGTSHGILDIGNSARTTVPNQFTHISAGGLIWGGWSCSINGNAYGALAIGYFAQALGGRGSVAFGNSVKAESDNQMVTGRNNIPANTARTVANGPNSSNKLNIEELSWSGDHCIAGGHQQKVTEIPAATSAYTLAEGCFEHTPSAAPTYTLPDPPIILIADQKQFLRATEYDGTGYYGWIYNTTKRYTASATPSVGDNTYTNTSLTSGENAITAIDSRTHEVILRVTFSNVQTLAFQDAQGNTLVPRPSLALASTSVVVYLCRWFGNAGGWTIYAVSEVE